MKQSEINHLRLLLGWVRTEIGQTPDELVDTVRRVAGGVEIGDSAKQRLVEAHDKAREVPKYVRAAEKALTKMLRDRGDVLDVPMREQKRIE